MGVRDLGKSTEQYAACRSSCLFVYKDAQDGRFGLGI